MGAELRAALRRRVEELFAEEGDRAGAEFKQEAGCLAVMNAHLWHGGTANRTGSPRTAVHAFFCRRDRPQQQYQKQLLRPEVQAALSPELRHLLALDDSLNDRLSAAPTTRSGFL